ncbi:MAG: GntR family transcriptional regulator [Acidobacteria bacterium]|nr:GntR family transcriptional regulator [Acidobacteriota bacterium]
MGQRKRTAEPLREFENRKVPLYYQLESILREKINSGEWTEGHQVPTESELVGQYGVSRITVRQALASLADEGLVSRIQGRGTYVTKRRPIKGAIRLTGFLEDLMAMGIETKVKTLEFKKLSAGVQEAEQLGVVPGDSIWQIKRVRFVKETPYSYIVSHLPEAIGDRITADELTHGSLLKLLEDKLGIRLGDASQMINAALADGYISGLLRTKVGAPLLSIERRVSGIDGRPVEFVRTLYRADMYCYSVKLTRGPHEVGTGWHYQIGNRD